MTLDRDSSSLCFQLRIDLLDSDPPIWRGLRLRADTSLVDVSRLLAATMGWSGKAEAQLQGHRIPDPGPASPGEAIGQPPLASLLRQPGDSLRYTYAPTLGWLHRVTLEAIEVLQPAEALPRCMAGERHCPPEFCAGVWGYEDLLDRLNDPEDPDYDQLWDQVGYDFDPETFDLEATNQRLQGLGSSSPDPLPPLA